MRKNFILATAFITIVFATFMLVKEDNSLKTYVVTCIPPMNTNDTIHTTNYLVNLRDTYRIGGAYYSTALCNVKRIQ